MTAGRHPIRKAPARGIVRSRRDARSTRRDSGVELVWEGKPAVGSIASADAAVTPFECVERLAFPASGLPTTAWRHRLFHGENKDVLRSLGAEFPHAIDLVYIDPPFDIGLDFGVHLPLGDGAHVDMPAYSDRWSQGTGSHAHMMWERLRLIRALLKPSGCIFLHCDWRSSAVMRLLLDEVFGTACFRNEIVWRRAPNLGRQAASNQLGRVAESILVYSAKPGTPFLGTPPTKSHPVPLDAKGRPRGAQWDDGRQRFFTTAPRGDYTDESIARLREAGRIHDTPSGRVYVKYFLRPGDDGRWYKDQPVDTIWDDPDVRPLRHCGREELAVGYATQKPEGLLRRIISWASPPGGLVADVFCGSGTTGVVAQRLGRRWIMADASPLAIRVARGRLIVEAGRSGAPPEGTAFEVLHAADRAEARPLTMSPGHDLAAYRQRVLDAFGADTSQPSEPFIHGLADQEAVHVGAPGSQLGADQVEAAARAAAQAGLTRLCCLAERFEPALHRSDIVDRSSGGVRVRLVPIPAHALDAGGCGRTAWPGLPAIEIDARHEGEGRVRVELVRCDWTGEPGGKDSLAGVDWWGIAATMDDTGPFTPQWQDQRTWRRRCVERTGRLEPAPGGGVPRAVRVRIMDVLGRRWSLDVSIDPMASERADAALTARRG